MNLVNAENPADIAGQTRDIVACLADLTSNGSGMAPHMSDRGWNGFCLLLLMVETELSKLTGLIEAKPPTSL